MFVALSLLVGVALAGAGGAWAAPEEFGWTTFSCFVTPTLRAVPGYDAAAAAHVEYNAGNLNRTGWANLKVRTNREYSDAHQMSAAGFCEGFATWEAIHYSRNNWYANSKWDKGLPSFIEQFMKTNLAWTIAQAESHWHTPKGNSDERRFWTHAYLVLKQIEGMSEGFQAAAPSGTDQLSLFDLYMMQAQGDVETLSAAMALLGAGDPKDDFPDFSKTDWNPIFHEHCSSLIKPTADGQELFAGHATWSGWGTFMRSYKSYTFPLANNTKGPSDDSHAGVSFSAYPATISSIDDWYVTTQNIAITETTNGIFNKTMLSTIKPQSILSWIRVVVANRLAVDGEEWTRLFAIDNSGTYNNQWIVVDYNKFSPSPDGKKQALKPGTLWIAEQVPELLERADMTDKLNEQGYWPSYNIPYFKNIFNSAGFPSMVEKYGQWFSYEGSPRAQIFKREEGGVNSLGRYQFMMRFNDWQNDPVSNGNAGNGIASRFDLVTQEDPKNPFLKKACFGAMDAKVTSAELMSNRRGRAAMAISGPTFYQQSVMKFTEPICDDIVHVGTPIEFNFGWEEFRAW